MGTAKIRDRYHQARWGEPIIYELSTEGERGILIPEVEQEIRNKVDSIDNIIPESMRRTEPPKLPELSQKQVLSHYVHLSQETLGSNLNIDISLGTCTMKYNPRVNETLVGLISDIHPLQDVDTIQGILEIYYKTEGFLKEISGMDKFSFQPGGGAHAVFAAASMIKAYHKANGELEQRDEIITTVFSHPCTSAVPATAGYKVITLYPTEDGYPDLDALKAVVSNRIAALFISNPEDTGIYNPIIDEFVKVVHEAGGLCYYDQANANGVLGIARARDAGFDVCHFNLHKTFASPHGCMGPGCGALGVTENLAKYLPVPTVELDEGKYYLDYDRPDSIGKVRGFFGVAPVVLRAYAWTMSMGAAGLREVAEISVLNNNYLLNKIKQIPGASVHYAEGHRRFGEVRYSWEKLKEDTGVDTIDVMHRIADFGLQHYFPSHEPWIVPEPFTLEPCESYSKDNIDEYAAVLRRVSEEAYNNPELVKSAPHKCASQKRDKEEEMNEPQNWAITWRAYQRKKDKL